MSETPLHRGACLCGAVRFGVSCALLDLPRSAVTIHGADNGTWYQSSAKVRRGF